MLRKCKTLCQDTIHTQNVETLVEKIAQSDAILVGAAAGTISSTTMMPCFRNIWEISTKSTALWVPLMDFIIITLHPKRAGHFWPVMDIWSTNVPLASPTTT